MALSGIIFATLILLRFQVESSPLPRQDSLVGYWPLDIESGIANIANGYVRHPISVSYVDKYCIDQRYNYYSPRLDLFSPSPYEDVECFSSYTVACTSCTVFYDENFQIPKSFTLTFLLFTDALQSGGIISFGQPNQQVFGISYHLKTVQLLRGNDSATICEATLLTPQTWHFLVVTVDGATGNIYLRNERGETMCESLFSTSQQARGLSLGETSGNLRLSKTDHLSCVMVFDSAPALSALDIQQIRQFCRDRAKESEAKCREQQTWPRRQSMVAFLPFDSGSLLQDVANKLPITPISPGTAKLVTDIYGPSSQSCTAFELTNMRHKAFASELSNFSISFFFYLNYWQGGDFTLIRFESPRDEHLFEIVAKGDSKKITVKVDSNDTGYESFPIAFQTWYLVSVTWDQRSTTMQVSVNNNHLAVNQIKIKLTDKTDFTLTNTCLQFITPLDRDELGKIACLAIYDSPLSAMELREVSQLCSSRSTSVDVLTSTKAQLSFPRRKLLSAFWPFDGADGCNDIANGLDLVPTAAATLAQHTKGPFNRYGTSYTISDQCVSDCYIASSRFLSVLNSSDLTLAFSVSLYFFTPADGTGAIISFDGLSLVYVEPNILEIWLLCEASLGSSCTDPKLAAKTAAVLKPNNWSFIMFTINVWPSDTITFMDEAGSELDVVILPDPFAFWFIRYGNVYIGKGFNGTVSNVTMKPNDAIACVLIYTDMLSGTDIAQLPRACETKGYELIPHSTDDPGAIGPGGLIGIIVGSIAAAALIALLIGLFLVKKARRYKEPLKDTEIHDLPVIYAPPLSDSVENAEDNYSDSGSLTDILVNRRDDRDHA